MLATFKVACEATKATKAVTHDCVSYLKGCEAMKAVTHDCDGCLQGGEVVTHYNYDSTLILVIIIECFWEIQVRRVI